MSSRDNVQPSLTGETLSNAFDQFLDAVDPVAGKLHRLLGTGAAAYLLGSAMLVPFAPHVDMAVGSLIVSIAMFLVGSIWGFTGARARQPR
jgi:hypothetical protein